MSENQPIDDADLPLFSRTHALLVALMLLGTFLTVWHPIYLAPPRFERTALLYLGLWLAWIPSTLLLRPSPTRWGRSVLGLVFILTACVSLAGFGQLPIGGFFTTIDCTAPQDMGGGNVRYVCVRQSIEERTIYTLEGPKGWPILRLVDYEFIP